MSEEIKVTKVSNVKFIVWFILGLVIGAGSLYVFNTYYMTKTPAVVANQMEQAQTQAQIKDLIERVGKLMILPTGEEPVVATINDAAALIKDQVFYKGSSNGDVVLVYQKAAKAIVYSPSKNLIVNVGPVFLQDQQAQTPAKTSASTTTTKR